LIIELKFRCAEQRGDYIEAVAATQQYANVASRTAIGCCSDLYNFWSKWPALLPDI
jgi:hypothetical protein